MVCLITGNKGFTNGHALLRMNIALYSPLLQLRKVGIIMGASVKVATAQIINDYKEGLMAKVNERYQAITKRLETEPNIIIRYELKVALEELITVYKLLFQEGNM